MEEEIYDWTKDEEWLAELEKRGDELRTGKVKGLSWDEVKTRALQAIEQSKVKV